MTNASTTVAPSYCVQSTGTVLRDGSPISTIMTRSQP